MNSSGYIVEEYNYDAWGRRRNPTDWSYSGVATPTYTQHGFTGHEHLDMFNLINMNGRIYDSEIARFLSPDPIIQSPYNLLNYNRYSYCLNNPLKYTDPSGYSYFQYMKDTYQSFYYRGGIYSHGEDGWSYSQPTLGGGMAPAANISYDALHPEGYHYNYSTHKYHDNSGGAVSYNEVHNNYVVPNSDFSFSGEIAQDIYRAMTQVSPSTNYTASADGTTGSPSESIASMLPVAFVMEGELSWEAVFAMSMTPGGIGLVLRGKNPGAVFFYSAGGVGGGWFGAAGSLNTAYFFYSGDVNKFSQYSLGGKSMVLSFSAGEGVSFGRSIILMKDNYGGVIIGIGTSIGAGGSPTVGSGQITIQQTHIWP